MNVIGMILAFRTGYPEIFGWFLGMVSISVVYLSHHVYLKHKRRRAADNEKKILLEEISILMSDIKDLQKKELSARAIRDELMRILGEMEGCGTQGQWQSVVDLLSQYCSSMDLIAIMERLSFYVETRAISLEDLKTNQKEFGSLLLLKERFPTVGIVEPAEA